LIQDITRQRTTKTTAIIAEKNAQKSFAIITVKRLTKMTKDYTIESEPCYSIKNEIAVLNYPPINLIQSIPIIDRNMYKIEQLVGFWKIKKLKV